MLLKRKEKNCWETLVKPGKKAKPGTKIIFGAYREDAAGNPVRYFRPKKKKKK